MSVDSTCTSLQADKYSSLHKPITQPVNYLLAQCTQGQLYQFVIGQLAISPEN